MAFLPAGTAKHVTFQVETSYAFAGLRLGTGCRSFSVPSSFASRLLLSRATNASKPSLTRTVFSLIPVNEMPFPIGRRLYSALFSCALICICHAYVHVKLERKSHVEVNPNPYKLEIQAGFHPLISQFSLVGKLPIPVKRS